MLAIAACHLNPGSGDADLRALRAFGPPAVDVLGPMPYMALRGMFDADAPAGLQNYWKPFHVDDLGDDAIETILADADADAVPPRRGQVHPHQLGVAMSRVPAGATAFGYRDAGFLPNIVGMWPDPAPARPTPPGRARIRPRAAAVPHRRRIREPHGRRGRRARAGGLRARTFARLAGLKAA